MADSTESVSLIQPPPALPTNATYYRDEDIELETQWLFPEIGGPMPHERLIHHRPQEVLGKNPYSEILAREAHQSHLDGLDQSNQEKADAAVASRIIREERIRAQLNPETGKKEEDADEDGSAILSQAARRRKLLGLPPATRKVVRDKPDPSLSVSTAAVDLSAANTTDAIAKALERSDNPRADTRYVALLDDTVGFPDADPLTLRRSEELASMAWPGVAIERVNSNSADKAQRHKGYFGAKIKSVCFADDNRSEELLNDAALVLDSSITADEAMLNVMFGAPRVELKKPTIVYSGSKDDRTLKATITGRPPHPWSNDRVAIEVYYSSFSGTMKSLATTVFMRSVPHVFSTLGVPIERFWAFMPFNLRMDLNERSDATITMKLVAKHQLRTYGAAMQLGIFGGKVATDATLSVTGFTSTTSPDATLRMAIVKEKSNFEAFKFRRISLLLAFLDKFGLIDVEFTATTANKRFTISSVWPVVDNFPALYHLLGEEKNVPMEGAISAAREIRLSTTRTCTHFLWSHFRLSNVAPFIEAVDGVPRHGVSCTFTATIARQDLHFTGRFETESKLDDGKLHFQAPLEGVWDNCYNIKFLRFVDARLYCAMSADTMMNPLLCEMRGLLGMGGLLLPAVVAYDLQNFSHTTVLAEIRNLRFSQLFAAMQEVGLACPSVVQGIVNTIHIESGFFSFCPTPGTMLVRQHHIKHGLTFHASKCSIAGHKGRGEFTLSADGTTILGSIFLDAPVQYGCAMVHSRNERGKGPTAVLCINVNSNKHLVNDAALPPDTSLDSPLLRDGVRLVGNLEVWDVSTMPCVVELADGSATISTSTQFTIPNEAEKLTMELEMHGLINPTPDGSLRTDNPQSVSIDGIDTMRVEGVLHGFSGLVDKAVRVEVQQRDVSVLASLEATKELLEKTLRNADWAAAELDQETQRRDETLAELSDLATEISALEDCCHSITRALEKERGAKKGILMYPLHVSALAAEAAATVMQVATLYGGESKLRNMLASNTAVERRADKSRAEIETTALRQRLRQLTLRSATLNRNKFALSALFATNDGTTISGELSCARFGLRLTNAFRIGDDAAHQPLSSAIPLTVEMAPSLRTASVIACIVSQARSAVDRWEATLDAPPSFAYYN